MSNQSNDRKISNFLAKTSLPSGSYLSFVSGGTNYKISLSDFLAALGVTGSIEQDGDPLGVPVLNISGSVNNIRNLEPGSGIKASVSPQNGVTLEHNFTEDTTGIELIDDLSADSPQFRSLQAGSGISISAAGGIIQITATGAVASSSTIIVNSISDFPSASSGVITLADDTEYLIRSSISTSNRFILGNGTTVSGGDSNTVTLEYTGTGNMFTASNASWVFDNIGLKCLSGTLFSSSGTGAEILEMLGCKINADDAGTISDFAGMQISSSQCSMATDGFKFAGSNGVLLFRDSKPTLSGGTMIDLGTATFDGLSIKSVFADLAAGTAFIDGAASSANINSDGIATMLDCHFTGAGSPLSTITIDDVRWQFVANEEIQDSHVIGHASLVGNATNTAISAANTPTLISGTWNIQHSARTTVTTAGRITLDAPRDRDLVITYAITIQPVSGTNKSIAVYLAKNGSVISNSVAAATISSGAPTRISQAWHNTASDGDYYELFVENKTDAIDILVSYASIVISD